MKSKYDLIAILETFFCILLNCYTAFAETDFCQAKDVYSSSVILDQTGRPFDYKFKLVRKAAVGFPTVIYIPGGPGQTSMDGNLNQTKTVPSEFGLILTDPRGVGCNFNSNLIADDFKTANLASDILSILEKLNLTPEYAILYGASYGTVLATTTAELNRRLGNKPFRLLVLEGTLGKAFSGPEYLNQYTSAWEKYVARNGGENYRVQIINAVEKNNLDKSSFASFLNGYLLLGAWGTQGHVLDIPLKLLQSDFEKFKTEYFTPGADYDTSNDTVKMYLTLWSQLWCREISNPGDGQQLVFENGKLIVRPIEDGKNDKSCNGAKPDRLYDSKAFSLREEIVYLQGEDDPATSAAQAYYHFQNQKSSNKRTFILFKQLGHAPSAIVQILMPGKLDVLWNLEFSENSLDVLKNTPFQINSQIKFQGE